MRWYRKELFLALVLFWGMGMNVHAEVVNGKPAPAFTLMDTSGKNHTLSDYNSIPSTDPANIAQAQNYVQLALDEVMAGKPVTVPMTKSYGCSVKY